MFDGIGLIRHNWPYNRHFTVCIVACRCIKRLWQFYELLFNLNGTICCVSLLNIFACKTKIHILNYTFLTSLLATFVSGFNLERTSILYNMDIWATHCVTYRNQLRSLWQLLLHLNGIAPFIIQSTTTRWIKLYIHASFSNISFQVIYVV